MRENDTNLEAIFPHLMLEGRAFTATIDRAYYSHYNPNMAEPTWLNHEAQWRSTTANFAEFKAATQAFLEHPDTILVPKGTAVIDLDLDTRSNGFYAQRLQMEDIAAAAKSRQRIKLYEAGFKFDYFLGKEDRRMIIPPGLPFFLSVMFKHEEIRRFDTQAAVWLHPDKAKKFAEKNPNKDLGIEMSVIERLYDSKIRVSLLGEHKHMSNLKHYLENCPGVFFSTFNNMVVQDRLKQLYGDLDIMFQIKPLFQKLLELWDENENFDAGLPDEPKHPLPDNFEGWIQALNEPQKRAIRSCWESKYFHLVIGPPGTGKSRLLTKFLEIAHANKKKVLVCSMNNSTVDTLMKYFTNTNYYKNYVQENPSKNTIIRGGNPYALDKKCLIYRVGNCIDTYSVERDQEAACEEFKSIRSVFCTLSGTYALALRNLVSNTNTEFDYIVVDEAGTCAHPYIFMAMTMGKKLIMAGDHNQLTPMIKATHLKASLEVSLFERLLKCEKFKKLNPPISSILTVQYRMHHLIAESSSKFFYEGRLEAAELNKFRTLSGDLPITVQGKLVNTKIPIMWIDHEGPEMDRELNPVDARIVGRMVQDLIRIRVQPEDIGVICAYKRQIRLVSEQIKQFTTSNALTVATIDSFQGAERDVIIISTSRSNDDMGIGFLRDERRINVAITRARKLVILVGNSKTLIQYQKRVSLKATYLELVLNCGKYLYYDYIDDIFNSTGFPSFFKKRFPNNRSQGGSGGPPPSGGGTATGNGHPENPEPNNYYARSPNGLYPGGPVSAQAPVLPRSPALPQGPVLPREQELAVVPNVVPVDRTQVAPVSQLSLRQKKTLKKQRQKEPKQAEIKQDKLTEVKQDKQSVQDQEYADSLADQAESEVDAQSTMSHAYQSALLANCLRIEPESESSSSSSSDEEIPQANQRSQTNRGRGSAKNFTRQTHQYPPRGGQPTHGHSLAAHSSRQRPQRSSQQDRARESVYKLRGSNAYRGQSNNYPVQPSHFDSTFELVITTKAEITMMKNKQKARKYLKPAPAGEEEFPKLTTN